jgi:hypothetical protein
MLSQRCVAEIDLRSLSSPIGLFLDGGDHAVCVPGECQRSSRSLSACPCIQAAAELYAAWDQAPRSRDANRVTRHRQPTTSKRPAFQCARLGDQERGPRGCAPVRGATYIFAALPQQEAISVRGSSATTRAVRHTGRDHRSSSLATPLGRRRLAA